MKTSVRYIFLSLAAGVVFSSADSNASPKGFGELIKDQVEYSDKHGGPDAYSRIFRTASEWALKDPHGSLAFFDKKLDSTDPMEVKCALMSIWALTKCIEVPPTTQVSQETKDRYKKAFPTEKIKRVLKAHPEYSSACGGLLSTSHAADLPEIQPFKAPAK